MFRPAYLGQVRLAQNQRSQGEQWWMHHILNTRAYAETTLKGDVFGSLKALGELWKSVLDWQTLTKSPVAGVLMAEHIALAKLLVDCFAQKKGGSCSDTAVEALLRNVDATAKLFPKDAAGFAGLFGPHTKLAGAYISDLAAGDQQAFEDHWRQALENGQALSKFTDDTFFITLR
jgi:hypothetical protein